MAKRWQLLKTGKETRPVDKYTDRQTDTKAKTAHSPGRQWKVMDKGRSIKYRNRNELDQNRNCSKGNYPWQSKSHIKTELPPF